MTHTLPVFHENLARSSAALTVPQHMPQSTEPTDICPARRVLLPTTAQPINHLADTMGGLAGESVGLYSMSAKIS